MGSSSHDRINELGPSKRDKRRPDRKVEKERFHRRRSRSPHRNSRKDKSSSHRHRKHKSRRSRSGGEIDDSSGGASPLRKLTPNEMVERGKNAVKAMRELLAYNYDLKKDLKEVGLNEICRN